MKKIVILLAMCLTFQMNAFAQTSGARSGQVEVGFSPEGSAEALVLKVIDSAKSNLQVIAYSFTSATVTRALLNASKRGVSVQVVADASNLKSRYSQSALSALSSAGIKVRTLDRYKITHDKYILVDGRHIETGSFNFSKAAAESNSENVIVLWDRPDIVSTYARHWKSRWDQATAFSPSY